MSQHTYQLKFTVSVQNPPSGTYPIHGETRDVKPIILTEEKENAIKAQIEKRIEEAIPTSQGAISVKFDSLTEE